MMPSTNMLQKTFLVKQGRILGTAFAVEWDGREYLVTAKHVVQNGSDPTEILHDETWKQLPVTRIYLHPGEPDVAVITLERQLAPRYQAELSLAGVKMGQDALMVGFPFGWNNTQFDFNNGYPIPFVKAAIISAFMFKNQTTVTYLDGHNNSGFSGGPIITDHDPPKHPSEGPRIIAVVASAGLEHTPHPNDLNPPQTHMAGHTLAQDHVHPTNAGFIVGYGINHVIDLIQENPHGFPLRP